MVGIAPKSTLLKSLFQPTACFSVTESVPCFARVKLIVLKVARCVTHSVSYGWGYACFVCLLVVGFKVVSILRLVTNLLVVVNYSIPSCQLAYALLMSRREAGVCGLRSVSYGLGMFFWWARYRVAVWRSICVRWCEVWRRWCCINGCSCARKSALYIVVCARTSFGRIHSVCGANHGGELSLGPAGYILIRGMDDTFR